MGKEGYITAIQQLDTVTPLVWEAATPSIVATLETSNCNPPGLQYTPELLQHCGKLMTLKDNQALQRESLGPLGNSESE